MPRSMQTRQKGGPAAHRWSPSKSTKRGGSGGGSIHMSAEEVSASEAKALSNIEEKIRMRDEIKAINDRVGELADGWDKAARSMDVDESDLQENKGTVLALLQNSAQSAGQRSRAMNTLQDWFLKVQSDGNAVGIDMDGAEGEGVDDEDIAASERAAISIVKGAGREKANLGKRFHASLESCKTAILNLSEAREEDMRKRAAELTETLARFEELQKELEERDAAMEQGSAMQERMKFRAETLRAELDEARADWESRMTEYEVIIGELERESAALEAKLRKQEMQMRAQEMELALKNPSAAGGVSSAAIKERNALDDANAEIANLKSRIAELEAELAKARAENEDWERKLSEAAEKAARELELAHQKIDFEVERARSMALKDADEEIERLKEVRAQLETDVEELQFDARNKDMALEAARDEIEDLKDEIKRLNARSAAGSGASAAQLEDMAKSHARELDDIREAHKEQLAETIDDMEKVYESRIAKLQYDHAIEIQAAAKELMGFADQAATVKGDDKAHGVDEFAVDAALMERGRRGRRRSSIVREQRIAEKKEIIAGGGGLKPGSVSYPRHSRRSRRRSTTRRSRRGSNASEASNADAETHALPNSGSASDDDGSAATSTVGGSRPGTAVDRGASGPTASAPSADYKSGDDGVIDYTPYADKQEPDRQFKDDQSAASVAAAGGDGDTHAGDTEAGGESSVPTVTIDAGKEAIAAASTVTEALRHDDAAGVSEPRSVDQSQSSERRQGNASAVDEAPHDEESSIEEPRHDDGAGKEASAAARRASVRDDESGVSDTHHDDEGGASQPRREESSRRGEPHHADASGDGKHQTDASGDSKRQADASGVDEPHHDATIAAPQAGNTPDPLEVVDQSFSSPGTADEGGTAGGDMFAVEADTGGDQAVASARSLGSREARATVPDARPTIDPSRDTEEKRDASADAGDVEEDVVRDERKNSSSDDDADNHAPTAVKSAAAISFRQSANLSRWVKKLVQDQLTPMIFRSTFLSAKARRLQKKNNELKLQVDALTAAAGGAATAASALAGAGGADLAAENAALRSIVTRQTAVLKEIAAYLETDASEEGQRLARVAREAVELSNKLDHVPVSAVDLPDPIPPDYDVSKLDPESRMAALEKIRQQLLLRVEELESGLSRESVAKVASLEEEVTALRQRLAQFAGDDGLAAKLATDTQLEELRQMCGQLHAHVVAAAGELVGPDESHRYVVGASDGVKSAAELVSADIHMLADALAVAGAHQLGGSSDLGSSDRFGGLVRDGDAGELETAEALVKRNQELARRKADLAAHHSHLGSEIEAMGDEDDERRNAKLAALHNSAISMQMLQEEREANLLAVMNAYARVHKLAKTVFKGQIYRHLVASMGGHQEHLHMKTMMQYSGELGIGYLPPLYGTAIRSYARTSEPGRRTHAIAPPTPVELAAPTMVTGTQFRAPNIRPAPPHLLAPDRGGADNGAVADAIRIPTLSGEVSQQRLYTRDGRSSGDPGASNVTFGVVSGAAGPTDLGPATEMEYAASPADRSGRLRKQQHRLHSSAPTARASDPSTLGGTALPALTTSAAGRR